MKLVLTDDTELTFSGNPGGDTDWPYIFEIEKDTWHGTVELDAAAAALSAGDIRLRISGTVNMAGDTLDCWVDSASAQPYEYPLTMPGFRGHPADTDAGVIPILRGDVKRLSWLASCKRICLVSQRNGNYACGNFPAGGSVEARV